MNNLGRDFWLFRSGQFISIIGDACSNIALAWWILDKTGSAAKMSAVLAPALFVQALLTPMAGPVGDRFPRKQLVLISDLWRAVFTLALAGTVFFDVFNLPLLIALYLLLSAGTAVFNSVSESIVPQLVTPENLPEAVRQTQAVSSAGSVAGGIAGGLIVTFLGVGGAFLFDAASFLVSAIGAALIRTDTRPAVKRPSADGSPLRDWAKELSAGVKTLCRLRLLLWMSLVAMSMNFLLAPVNIILPVLVKQQRGLPPWFLGGLESSGGLGTILGALLLGRVCRKFAADKVTIFGLVLIGVGIMGMGWVPTVALPMLMMLLLGIGMSLCNIPLATAMALCVPDAYRSRLSSIRFFLNRCAMPLGMALAGGLISNFGLMATLIAVGGGIVVLSPMLLALPLFSDLINAPPAQAQTFLQRHYPGVFDEESSGSYPAPGVVQPGV